MDGLAAVVRDHPDGAIISVRVTPRSGKTAIIGVEGDALRVRVAAAPVDGAANKALMRFMAEAVGVPRSAVTIIAGASSPRKRLLVAGVEARDVMRWLKDTWALQIRW